MPRFEKGKLLYEGKTKKIWGVVDSPHLVIVENKNDITKDDDPALTQKFDTKAVYATTTTCRVFELLNKAGISTSFRAQISDTEFVALKCDMVQLEVIARRYAVGSYLKRSLHLGKAEGSAPHRFHCLVIEFFLKTTGKKLVQGDTTLVDSLAVDDPFIINPYDDEWSLFHPKKPKWDPEADLKKTVSPQKVLDRYKDRIKEIEELTRKIFLVLEGAWGTLGYRLVDFKIEFGIDQDGNLVVSDVIDNDSWRLRDANWEELSKQLFRDNADMSEIKEKYGIVASLTERFRVPKQALVLWCGSKSDPLPEIPVIPGVIVHQVVKSYHKGTVNASAHMEDILAIYPDGGVFLFLIGMSNGAGPTGSAHTSWPSFNVPVGYKEFPMDVWSNLQCPSNVPAATILSPKNAVLAALNILAQKNPIAYMERQLVIEELDGNMFLIQ